MPETLEVVANTTCQVGENPLWHPIEKMVYWLDIPTGAIYRYDPQTGTHEIFHQGQGMTGGFTIQADGSLLLFSLGGKVQRLNDGKLTTLINSLPGEENNRFNDAIADPRGRVFTGTMLSSAQNPAGNLYRLDLNGTFTWLREGLKLSNGMGFSPDNKTFYHSDSQAHNITSYDYHEESGNLANPRTFAELPEDQGVPDGLTVDADGFVWLACWDGWQLLRYDPHGHIERRISFPVKRVSSLTFAGEDLSDIYVTTAGSENPSQNGAMAGALFRLRLGIQGKPEYLSRIQSE